jgi:hypothetical protein
MSIAQPSSNNRDKPDSNTRLLFMGGLLAALIGGVCLVLGVIAQPIVAGLVITATPSPSPTPVTPTPTLTPTPNSPAEAALVQYLAAARAAASDREACARLSSLVSDYSLEFLRFTRQDVEDTCESEVAIGHILVDFKVIGSDVLDEDSVHFDTVWTIDEVGSPKKTEKAFTVHKDKDGVWRVNVGDLVDYRHVTPTVSFDATTGISINPTLNVERYETYLSVIYDINSPTGEYVWLEGGRPSCQFPSRSVSAEFKDVNTITVIHLDGFFEDYPISCTFPDLDTAPSVKPRWIAPTIILNYK